MCHRSNVTAAMWILASVTLAALLPSCGWHEPSTAQRSPIDTSSPEKVFAAYSKALKEGRWKDAWSLMTPEQQDYQLFELIFALGMIGKDELTEQHLDAEKNKQVDVLVKKRDEVAAAIVGEESAEARRKHEKLVEAVQKAYVDSLRDKEKFYAAAMQELQERLRAELPDGVLRNVEIQRKRARGTRTQHIYSISTRDGVETHHKDPVQSPVYFRKTEHGWRIDALTEEEAIAEARKAGLIPEAP